MVHLKGEFKELMTPGSHIFNTDDYIYVTLTDEADITNIGRILDLLDDDDDVQEVYHNWEE